MTIAFIILASLNIIFVLWAVSCATSKLDLNQGVYLLTDAWYVASNKPNKPKFSILARTKNLGLIDVNTRDYILVTINNHVNELARKELNLKSGDIYLFRPIHHIGNRDGYMWLKGRVVLCEHPNRDGRLYKVIKVENGCAQLEYYYYGVPDYKIVPVTDIYGHFHSKLDTDFLN